VVPDGGEGRLTERPRAVAIVTATWLETAAAQLCARGVRVIGAGVSLRRLDGSALPEAVLSCGLAGALDPRLRRGDLVVPDFLVDAGGRRFDCDPELAARLRGAAAELGHSAWGGGLLTSDRLLVAGDRLRSGAEGLVAVDMEAALLAARVRRIAAVKVVLDTFQEELSADWGDPARALRNPARWAEGGRLAAAAPRLAARAARVAAASLRAARRPQRGLRPGRRRPPRP
jgi:hypothetical protein